MAPPSKSKVLKPEETLVALGQAGEAIVSAKAATPVKAILPPQEVTVDGKNVSHHFITDKHLGRLRVAADGKMSPAIELAVGALLGNTAAFLGAASNIYTNGLQKITVLDFISVVLMGIFASASLVLLYVRRGKHRESVSGICDEIEKRETRVLQPDSVDPNQPAT